MGSTSNRWLPPLCACTTRTVAGAREGVEASRARTADRHQEASTRRTPHKCVAVPLVGRRQGAPPIGGQRRHVGYRRGDGRRSLCGLSSTLLHRVVCLSNAKRWWAGSVAESGMRCRTLYTRTRTHVHARTHTRTRTRTRTRARAHTLPYTHTQTRMPATYVCRMPVSRILVSVCVPAASRNS